MQVGVTVRGDVVWFCDDLVRRYKGGAPLFNTEGVEAVIEALGSVAEEFVSFGRYRFQRKLVDSACIIVNVVCRKCIS